MAKHFVLDSAKKEVKKEDLVRNQKETELVGKVFGRWTIIKDLGFIQDKYARKRKVCVKCECGNQREHFYVVLKNGLSTSCGCFRIQSQGERAKKQVKHSLSKHPLFQLWRGMKGRCLNPNDKGFKAYGGRGITVCDEWVNDFKAFYDWAMANGWEKGLLNDRRDNDKGYSPENCRFVTPMISSRNTRMNNNITFNGVTKCITDWAKDVGVSATSMKKRIEKWGVEKAVTTPKIMQYE